MLCVQKLLTLFYWTYLNAALRFSDEYGPPDPKFGGFPGPVSPPLRSEIHEMQHPDVYTESQVVNCKISLFVEIN